MLQPLSDPDPLRLREAVVARSYLAPAAMVREAVERWALDSGWVPAREMGRALTYVGDDASGFLGWLSFGVFKTFQVTVSLAEHDGRTEAVFFVEVAGQLPGVEEDLKRAAETFARGASSYLEQLTAAHPEHALGGMLTRRSRRGLLTRCLKSSQIALVILLLPAAALTYLISRSDLITAAVWLWVGALLLSVMFARYRLYGMHMWLLAPAVGILLTGTILATVALAFD